MHLTGRLRKTDRLPERTHLQRSLLNILSPFEMLIVTFPNSAHLWPFMTVNPCTTLPLVRLFLSLFLSVFSFLFNVLWMLSNGSTLLRD